MTSPHPRFRFHYVDDSGAADTGYTTFTWLALAPEHWSGARQQWQSFRADLKERHRILTHTRLHATDLAAGRGRPSLNPAFDVRAHGPRIVREGLEVISALDGLSVGTVYRHSRRPGRTKPDLYRALLGYLDSELHRAATLGMIFMDGDGSDRRYTRVHRDLAPSVPHVVEAPVFRSADEDQWVQMADFAAWSAYQTILRRPGKRRLWTWYPRTVGRHDPCGPLAL